VSYHEVWFVLLCVRLVDICLDTFSVGYDMFGYFILRERLKHIYESHFSKKYVCCVFTETLIIFHSAMMFKMIINGYLFTVFLAVTFKQNKLNYINRNVNLH
jgi:hypothetical protein